MLRSLPPSITDHLALPVFVAPMFLVSGPDFVLASCKAGVLGSFPAPNTRTVEELEDWLRRISTEHEAARRAYPNRKIAPWALNMVVHTTYARFEQELALAVKYRAPIVITALGSPKRVVDAVHSYGGLVFADVNSVSFAKKACETGIDGLILVSAGAGGHVGPLAGFAFLPEVRQFWNGPIVLAGAISNGRAVRAVEVLGADIAYIGTRFIAAQESLVPDAYREMVIGAGAEDIVLTDAITGVKANFLAPSLTAAGYDVRNMQPRGKVDFSKNDDKKAWKHVWAAGQGVAAIRRVETVAEIVDQLKQEYRVAVADGKRPNRWLESTDEALTLQRARA
ncbi:MAG: NAD(P)H-dependent flavin oxidoreductase [Alphaproteobacteria bacterium]